MTPPTKTKRTVCGLASLALRCYDRQKDAPDHKADNAVDAVVPRLRHVASLRLNGDGVSQIAGYADATTYLNRVSAPSGRSEIV
jgi:hypothetical protein